MHCDNYCRLRMYDFQDSLVGAWIRCNDHKLNNAMMCGMHRVHAQDAYVCKSGSMLKQMPHKYQYTMSCALMHVEAYNRHTI